MRSIKAELIGSGAGSLASGVIEGISRKIPKFDGAGKIIINTVVSDKVSDKAKEKYQQKTKEKE